LERAVTDANSQSFWRRHWIWLFVLSYACKWIYLFHRVDFSSDFPIVNNDYIQYYARVLRIFEFLKHGRFWGYDPYEMAGYPAVLREVGTFFMAVLAYGLSALFSVKTTVLFCEMAGHLLVPLLIVPTIRNIGGSKENAAVGFAILVVMYGGVDLLSSVVITQGIFGFTLACFVAIWHTSLFWRWLVRKEWSTWGWLLFASVVLPQLHPSAVIIGLVPMVVLFAAYVRQFRARDVIQLVVVVAIAIAGNWYWVRPYLAFSSWVDLLPYWQSGWTWFYQLTVPAQSTWYYAVRAFAHLLLLGVLVASLRATFRISKFNFYVLASWIAWLALMVFEGSYFPFIKTLQPFRFVLAFWLVIIVVAASQFEISRFKPKEQTAFGVFMIVVLIAGWYQTVNMARTTIPLFTTRLGKTQQPFLDYVRSAPPFSGRLLLECGYRRIPNIDDICAVLSKQPLLGGHDPGNFLKARFTVFGGIDQNLPADYDMKEKPVAFGRPLITYFDNEGLLTGYLRLYNVTEIAAWSAQTVRILNQFPDVMTLNGKKGEYSMYDVHLGTPTWFVRGSGDLLADYDEIKIANASTGRIVLKFHWIKTLKCDPPLPMRPVFLMGDPVPFIQLDNAMGSKNIRIFNAGV
jgi:hypothetical protein